MWNLTPCKEIRITDPISQTGNWLSNLSKLTWLVSGRLGIEFWTGSKIWPTPPACLLSSKVLPSYKPSSEWMAVGAEITTVNCCPGINYFFLLYSLLHWSHTSIFNIVQHFAFSTLVSELLPLITLFCIVFLIRFHSNLVHF